MKTRNYLAAPYIGNKTHRLFEQTGTTPLLEQVASSRKIKGKLLTKYNKHEGTYLNAFLKVASTK